MLFILLLWDGHTAPRCYSMLSFVQTRHAVSPAFCISLECELAVVVSGARADFWRHCLTSQRPLDIRWPQHPSQRGWRHLVLNLRSSWKCRLQKNGSAVGRDPTAPTDQFIDFRVSATLPYFFQYTILMQILKKTQTLKKSAKFRLSRKLCPVVRTGASRHFTAWALLMLLFSWTE